MEDKKRELLDPSLKPVAMQLSERELSSMRGLMQVTAQTFMQLSMELRSNFPAMGGLHMISFPLPENVSLPNYGSPAVKKGALPSFAFSGNTDFATKCRETAALNYVLDGDEDRYQAALARVKKLFDYSEHFDNHPNHNQMVQVGNALKCLSYRGYDRDVWEKFSFVNKFGVPFKYQGTHSIQYVHPNDPIELDTTATPIFVGDIRLIDDKLKEICTGLGFVWPIHEFHEGEYIISHLRLFEYVLHVMIQRYVQSVEAIKSNGYSPNREYLCEVFEPTISYNDRYRKRDSKTCFEGNVRHFYDTPQDAVPDRSTLSIKNGELEILFHFKIDQNYQVSSFEYRCHTFPASSRFDEVEVDTMLTQIKVREFISLLLAQIASPFAFCEPEFEHPPFEVVQPETELSPSDEE